HYYSPVAVVSLMLQLPPTSPLFPYTTLFRSDDPDAADDDAHLAPAHRLLRPHRPRRPGPVLVYRELRQYHSAELRGRVGKPVQRSEEHTSELQSQSNLVCRLLLEKKKNYLEIVECIAQGYIFKHYIAAILNP